MGTLLFKNAIVIAIVQTNSHNSVFNLSIIFLLLVIVLLISSIVFDNKK
jgi:hypothetical protein